MSAMLKNLTCHSSLQTFLGKQPLLTAITKLFVVLNPLKKTAGDLKKTETWK